MAILQLENVKYRYVNPYVTVEAVRGISYSFEKGTLYTLQGASGSGKTTLLSLMAGLDLPSEGSVLFDGRATSKLDLHRYRRESVAIIYQNYNLLPLLTVAENVMYPMELNHVRPRAARERARRLIHDVGLTDDQFVRFPSMLSGGQQQRVAIARALGTPAQVILADEPTGNLDVENGRNVITLLKRLAHEQQYCVIIVTHDQKIAAESDIRITLEDGAIAGVASPAPF